MTIQEANGASVVIIGVVKRDPDRSRDERQLPTIYFNDSVHGAAAGVRFRAPLTPASTIVEMNVNFVSPGYLRAMGLSLVGGQWFPEHGVAGECRHLGVINQEAADLYFGGKGLGAALIDNIGIRTEIIGIVRSQALGTFEQQAQPTIYIPMW